MLLLMLCLLMLFCMYIMIDCVYVCCWFVCVLSPLCLLHGVLFCCCWFSCVLLLLVLLLLVRLCLVLLAFVYAVLFGCNARLCVNRAYCGCVGHPPALFAVSNCQSLVYVFV